MYFCSIGTVDCKQACHKYKYVQGKEKICGDKPPTNLLRDSHNKDWVHKVN